MRSSAARPLGGRVVRRRPAWSRRRDGDRAHARRRRARRRGKTLELRDARGVRDVLRERLRARHPSRSLLRPATAVARFARSGGRCSVRSSPRARAARAAPRVRSCPIPARAAAGRVGSTAGGRSRSTFPRGIDDGQRLRLAGRGPAAPRGGTFGGPLRVGPGRAATRSSNAAATSSGTGCPSRSCRRRSARRSRFATLDGPREVDVAAGTQPGAILRLRGLGVPSLRTSRRGDLVVEVRVEVPMRLNAEEAELLAKFAELRGEKVSSVHEGLLVAHPVGVQAVMRIVDRAPGPRTGGRRCGRPRLRRRARRSLRDHR